MFDAVPSISLFFPFASLHVLRFPLASALFDILTSISSKLSLWSPSSGNYFHLVVCNSRLSLLLPTQPPFCCCPVFHVLSCPHLILIFCVSTLRTLISHFFLFQMTYCFPLTIAPEFPPHFCVLGAFCPFFMSCDLQLVLFLFPSLALALQSPILPFIFELFRPCVPHCFSCVLNLSLPYLTLPCLALRCLALPCLALPYLTFVCALRPCHSLTEHASGGTPRLHLQRRWKLFVGWQAIMIVWLTSKSQINERSIRSTMFIQNSFQHD